MPVQEEDYGLIVGIDHYPDFRNLKGATEDAKAFDEWLTDTNIGGGVKKENRRLVLSTPEPYMPIQHHIDTALRELLENVPKARRFYLYFSGHGLSSSRMGVDLCSALWSHNVRNAALDSGKYLDYLSHIGKFKQLVLFLDCCRLREVNTGGFGPVMNPPSHSIASGIDRHLIGYSTEYQNSAYEAAQDIDPDDVRGYFTTALLEALYGKAARSTGGVTAHRLKHYIETRTAFLAKKDNRNQQPDVSISFRADEEVIFGSATPDRSVVIEFPEERYGNLIKIYDAKNREVSSTQASSQNWEIKLGEGIHILVDTADDSEKSIREGDEYVQFKY